jgi:hypothetical protein
LCIFVDLCGSLDSLWIFVDLSEYVVDLCGMLLICERNYWISVELFVDPYNYGSLWIGVGIRGSLWIFVDQCVSMEDIKWIFVDHWDIEVDLCGSSWTCLDHRHRIVRCTLPVSL